MTDLTPTINDLLRNLQIDVSHSEKISTFLSFLIEKNKEINLVSRKLTIDDIMQDHVFDCLAGYHHFTKMESVTDIGSGGGFPLMLLAACCPEISFTGIEKSVRKAAFLREAVTECGLQNVTIREGKVEDMNLASSALTCRAFKPLAVLLRLTRDFFNNGNSYILYKGRLETIDEEIKDAKKEFTFNVQIHKIAEITEKERHILCVKKK